MQGDGSTPFIMACRQRKAADLINLFLKYGASVYSQLKVRDLDITLLLYIPEPILIRMA